MNANFLATQICRSALAAGAALALAAPAHAALQGRDLDGNTATFEAYYDTLLDITWYADLQGFTGTVAQVTSAVNNFSIGGFSDWRLPMTRPIDIFSGTFTYSFSNNGSTDVGTAHIGNGWGDTANEMGHLYYVTLLNHGIYAPNDGFPGTMVLNPNYDQDLLNKGPFGQWSNRSYISSSVSNFGSPHTFLFNLGYAWLLSEGGTVNAIAVRDGDTVMAAIPEPSSYAMMLAGLLAVGASVRRRIGRSQ